MRSLSSFVVCCLLLLCNGLYGTPVAINDTIYLDEDDFIFYNVLSNDFDTNGASLYSFILNESQSSFASLSSDGILWVNPTNNFFGEFDITYQCCNSLSATECVIGFVHVVVAPINDAPIACMLGGIKICQGQSLTQDIFYNSSIDTQEGQVTSLTSFTASPGMFAFNPDGLVSIYPPENYVGPITVNYTVCDNGTPQLCSSFVNTSLVVVDDQFVLSPSVNPPTCIGRTNGHILLGVSGGIGYYQYSWSHGPSGSIAYSLGIGTYFVSIHDQGNCAPDTTVQFELTSTQVLNYALSDIQLNCTEATAGIDLTINGGTPNYQVIWEDGSEETTQTIPFDTAISVTIKDVLGCRLDTSVYVSSDPCLFENVFFPEGFSPNNDGYNDYFQIVDLLPSQQGSLVVWNVSGRTVFTSEEYNNDWGGRDDTTGELVPPSTYYYVFKVNNSDQQKEGVITIQY